jgi:hypothetical protein
MLGFVQGDDGSLESVSLTPTGTNIIFRTGSYIYTSLTDKITCMALSANTYTHLKIVTSGMIANNGSISVNIGYDTANLTGACSQGLLQGVQLSTWTVDPVTGYEVGLIPLSSYTSVNFNRLASVVFTNPWAPLSTLVTLRGISFV